MGDDDERASRRGGQHKGAAAKSHRKAKTAVLWARDEWLQLRESMLRVGHHAAPERAAADATASATKPVAGGASASTDAPAADAAGGMGAPRELREYRRAADYLLALTLLHASPELSSQWQPMSLHTQSDKSFNAMVDESRKGAAKADARAAAKGKDKDVF